MSSKDPLNPESQTSQLVNIEYNQLSTVLESSDDLSSGDINDPKTGYSPYPGNMNQFIVKLRPYEKILNKNLGLLKEFINSSTSSSLV